MATPLIMLSMVSLALALDFNLGFEVYPCRYPSLLSYTKLEGSLKEPIEIIGTSMISMTPMTRLNRAYLEVVRVSSRGSRGRPGEGLESPRILE